jgi:hypothetical protein
VDTVNYFQLKHTIVSFHLFAFCKFVKVKNETTEYEIGQCSTIQIPDNSVTNMHSQIGTYYLKEDAIKKTLKIII